MGYYEKACKLGQLNRERERESNPHVTLYLWTFPGVTPNFESLIKLERKATTIKLFVIACI